MDTEGRYSVRVYVAGPYTSDPGTNVHTAIKAAQRLLENGYYPFVPHLFHLWHMIIPGSSEQWIGLELEWLRSCHVLVRLPGDSSGADREVAEALRLGIPVYFSIDDFLLKYADSVHPAPPAPEKITVPVQGLDGSDLSFSHMYLLDKIEDVSGKVNRLGDSFDECCDRSDVGLRSLQVVLNKIIFSLGSDLTGMQNRVCRVCRKIWDTHTQGGTFACPEVMSIMEEYDGRKRDL